MYSFFMYEQMSATFSKANICALDCLDNTERHTTYLQIPENEVMIYMYMHIYTYKERVLNISSREMPTVHW